MMAQYMITDFFFLFILLCLYGETLASHRDLVYYVLYITNFRRIGGRRDFLFITIFQSFSGPHFPLI